MKCTFNIISNKKHYDKNKEKKIAYIINIKKYYNKKKELFNHILEKKSNKKISIIKPSRNILLLLIIIFVYLTSFFSQNKIIKSRKLNSISSQITLTFKKSEEPLQTIRNSEIFPLKIIINEQDVTSSIPSNMKYTFEREENTVIFIWNEKIQSCSGMFEKIQMKTIDLSKFDSSYVIDTSRMFYQCQNLTYINLKDFDTSLVTNIEQMFLGCNLITSLDLSSFETSRVQNMRGLFAYNFNLESINLSNFDTSLVTDISSMFMQCFKLSSINLSSFKTNSLKKMNKLFLRCTSLEYLDLSSFDISNVDDMNSCFYECTNLENIDLKNFDTSKVTNMKWMFSQCNKLKSLDISNFDMTKVKVIADMFSYCENLEYIKFNNLNLLNSIQESNNLFYNCKKLESLDLSFLNISLVNDMEYMFYGCEELKYLNLLNFNTSSVTKMSYMFDGCKSLQFLNIPLFIENNDLDFSNMFNNFSSNLIYCIKDYSKTENIISLLDEKNTKNNCSNLCFHDNIKFIFEENKCICQEDILYETIKEHYCLKECNSQDFINNICKARNNSLSIKMIIINQIREDIQNGELKEQLQNVTNDEKKDIEIYEDNMIYQITSTYNQNYKKYSNISTLKFEECENLLKSIYEIDESEALLILKIDIHEEGLKMPIVEYEVYHPLTLEKLNLSYCLNSSIEISVPVTINENELVKYDPTSALYNDRCHPYTSENKTDVVLKDRQL